MTTAAERQALDVGYRSSRYQRPGSTSAETLAIPDAWYGKYVDFAFLDTSASTNVCYVLFGADNTVAASVAPTDSVVTTNVMTPIDTGGSHIQIPSGTVRPVRIPPKNAAGVGPIAFFSHIEGAASGKLRMTLSTGEG